MGKSQGCKMAALSPWSRWVWANCVCSGFHVAD